MKITLKGPDGNDKKLLVPEGCPDFEFLPPLPGYGAVEENIRFDADGRGNFIAWRSMSETQKRHAASVAAAWFQNQALKNGEYRCVQCNLNNSACKCQQREFFMGPNMQYEKAAKTWDAMIDWGDEPEAGDE